MEDKTILKLCSMSLITLLLIVDAFTWQIDHALWTTAIAAIAGLAGYEIGTARVLKTEKR